MNKREDNLYGLKKTDMHKAARLYQIAAALIAVLLTGILLLTVAYMPRYGSDNTPMTDEVMQRYIEKGVEETGAINLVAGMILDYRAFDTFGESCVLFLAVTAVFILLRHDKNNADMQNKLEEKEDSWFEVVHKNQIVATIAHYVVPFVLMLGIYVILNGHLSAGGGFAGGTILGAGLIIYELAFGFDKIHHFFSERTFKIVTLVCLLVYCLAKGYSFFTGANGLESGIPLGTPGAILSSGLILVLNICVGLIVGCTVYGFYILFMRGEM